MAVEQLVTRDEIIANVGNAAGDGARHIKLSEIVALKDI